MYLSRVETQQTSNNSSGMFIQLGVRQADIFGSALLETANAPLFTFKNLSNFQLETDYTSQGHISIRRK